ncbi:regulatory factor X-associated protein [Canis lupus baileyi]|uniref:regulatory factor X-associated protein n=1 Tax=Canis lupus baileyi TaxID=143281 RepID=UPI003B976E38
MTVNVKRKNKFIRNKSCRISTQIELGPQVSFSAIRFSNGPPLPSWTDAPSPGLGHRPPHPSFASPTPGSVGRTMVAAKKRRLTGRPGASRPHTSGGAAAAAPTNPPPPPPAPRLRSAGPGAGAGAVGAARRSRSVSRRLARTLGCGEPLGPAGAEGLGSWTPQGVSSTEVQGVVDGAGPGAACGALRPGAPTPAPAPAPAPAPGQALAPAPVPAAASQFALLVMHPCGGQDDSAAEGVPRRAPALGDGAGAGKPIRYLCEVAGAGEEEAGDDEADLLDASDAPGGGESTASLEDLEDEETHSGGEGGSGGARRRGGGGGSTSKTCTFEGCSETTSQVAKQRKPWMCKKHRNKMYKDKYKKKKSDQALNCSGAAQAGSTGNVRLEESTDNILSIVKQRTGTFGDRPARPTLLEQVLNQKRLSLLRSPEVVQFLQKQQQLLNQQVLEQRQQQFPGTSV